MCIIGNPHIKFTDALGALGRNFYQNPRAIVTSDNQTAKRLCFPKYGIFTGPTIIVRIWLCNATRIALCHRYAYEHPSPVRSDSDYG